MYTETDSCINETKLFSNKNHKPVLKKPNSFTVTAQLSLSSKKLHPHGDRPMSFIKLVLTPGFTFKKSHIGVHEQQFHWNSAAASLTPAPRGESAVARSIADGWHRKSIWQNLNELCAFISAASYLLKLVTKLCINEVLHHSSSECQHHCSRCACIGDRWYRWRRCCLSCLLLWAKSPNHSFPMKSMQN